MENARHNRPCCFSRFSGESDPSRTAQPYGQHKARAHAKHAYQLPLGAFAPLRGVHGLKPTVIRARPHQTSFPVHPEARLEISFVHYEDEDAHIWISLPATLTEAEQEDLANRIAEKSLDALLTEGFLILAGIEESEPTSSSS